MYVLILLTSYKFCKVKNHVRFPKQGLVPSLNMLGVQIMLIAVHEKPSMLIYQLIDYSVPMQSAVLIFSSCSHLNGDQNFRKHQWYTNIQS